MSENISGGEAIIRAVVNNGIDTIYGLPGAQMYPLFDALHRHSDMVRTITPRHEQTAAYMAFGHAQSTGNASAYSVVPGPGVLNTTAALSTAWGCNAPVMCLTGQIPSNYLGKRRGHLHEIPDQLATLKSLVKWADRIDSPEQAPALVDAAFSQMMSGRRGPVSLEMCWDVMASKGDVDFLDPVTLAAPLQPDPEAIRDAVKLLDGAKNILILVGGGAQHASEEVRILAETLGAGVTSFRAGKGIVSEDHALGMSCAAAYDLWADTDVLIGIGTRMELTHMRWTGMQQLIDKPDAPPYIIRIDVDSEEMVRFTAHAAIVSDAATGAAALAEAAIKSFKPSPDSIERITAAKAQARRNFEKVQPHVAYLDIIRGVLPRDGFLVEELCQAGFTSNFAFPVYEPRTYVTTGFQGTLGFGFPTSLGVKAANPDKAVISITGDGGFMFAMPELATAVQYGLGVVTIVFNNQAFGNVRRDQQMGFDGRLIGADLVNPDFVKLGESFGMPSHRVTSPQMLKPILQMAIDNDEPALIEVVVDKASEVSPWEFIIKRPQ